MLRLAAAVILALLVPQICGAKSNRATLRAHLEGAEMDGSSFSTPFTSPVTGRKLTLQKIPVISENDVVSFRPRTAGDGTFGAIFTLDDHGRIALDAASIENRGKLLYVFVNARPITELQIDRRVSDGKLYLPAGLTSADIESMKKKWPITPAKKNEPAAETTR